jgi:hypothetical protein
MIQKKQTRGLTMALSVCAAFIMAPNMPAAEGNKMKLEPQWEYVADTVMGGVSDGKLTRTEIDGRDAVQLSGDVSLENNGGFIQMAFDLEGGAAFDASAWQGIEIDVRGNGAAYEMRLRTDQLSRPWQSFKADITAQPEWQTVRLPWASFEAHRTDATFDPERLRRIGILAIGAEMQADIAIAEIRLFQ